MEEAEQQQQEEYDNAGIHAYAPPIDRYGGSIVTLTNPEEDLYRFELFLRSQMPNQDGTLKEIGDPLLNDKGVNMVMSSIKSVVHQTNTLSNFDERDIIYLHDTLKDNLIQDIMVNKESYDVQRKNRDVIVGNSLRFAYGFMKRAFEEGDRKFWKGSTTEIRHTQDVEQRQQQQKRSFNPFKFGR